MAESRGMMKRIMGCMFMIELQTTLKLGVVVFVHFGVISKKEMSLNIS